MEVLDRHFSKYIRLRDAIKTTGSEEVKCFTCGKVDNYRDMHCGHFLSRNDLGVRYHEYNCHAQCPYCNVILSGNLEVYESKMIEAYGQDKIDHLRRLAKSTIKWTKWEFEVLIKDYKERVKDLEQFLRTN